MAKTSNKVEKELETKEETKKETNCEITAEEQENTCTLADHISKEKVVDIIKDTMLQYKGKVVLAMTEVKDIINKILADINK